MPQPPPGEREQPDPDRDGLSRARSVLLGILSVEVGVLVVTGIALFFLYRPSVEQSWPGLVTRSNDWDVRFPAGLRLVHRLASSLAVPTAVAAGVLVAMAGRARVARWLRAALGAAIPITTLAASFTGFLLPWDQLALSAVTVGTNLRGYRALFDPVVRFVLLDGVELSPGTVIRWLLVHMLVLGPALVGLVLLGWSRPGETASQKED